MMQFVRNIIWIIFVILPSLIWADEIVVVGQIRDEYRKQAIPSVNVFFKGMTTGVLSDEDGFFYIRGNEKTNVLIFSCVGYQTKTIKLQPGKSAGLQVEMKEEINQLQDLFVLPGTNPALEILSKLRLNKARNDLFLQPDLQFLVEKKDTARIIFGGNDRPVFFASEMYKQSGKTKVRVSREAFSSPENLEPVIEKFVGDMPGDVNFYQPAIRLFGQSFISPFSASSNTYYQFFLIDSLQIDGRKNYYLRFKSRNPKNLAFHGECYIDAENFGIKKVSTSLPVQANLNFIQTLKIDFEYKLSDDSLWLPFSRNIHTSFDKNWFPDSLNRIGQLIIDNVENFRIADSSLTLIKQKSYVRQELDLKKQLEDFNQTPIMRIARFVADAALTGYMDAGKFDVGKIQNLMRLSEIEGFKLNIPIRTNEDLWKNISLGGSVGYGTRNKKFGYMADIQFRLPAPHKLVVGAGLFSDYRRVDYDPLDYQIRENPLSEGDEDINTVLGLSESRRLNMREEKNLSLSYDWTSGFESLIAFRTDKSFSNTMLPMSYNGIGVDFIETRSLVLMNRFSFFEKSYEDHLNRIYIGNRRPVIYFIAEGGQFFAGQKTGYFARFRSSIRQNIQLDFGKLDYVFETGVNLGKLPYNILYTPLGNPGAAFSKYRFGLMNPMEFGADKYMLTHQELTFNGVLLNYIPLINKLNLREFMSFKAFYGSLSDQHAQILDMPFYSPGAGKLYAEAGIGVANILRVLTVQSVWRLTDRNNPDVRKWSIMTALRIGF